MIYREASKLLRRATEQMPSNGNAAYHLAAALAANGNEQEAVAILETLITNDRRFSSEPKLSHFS